MALKALHLAQRHAAAMSQLSFRRPTFLGHTNVLAAQPLVVVPNRTIHKTAPVCMGRRSAKIAGRKGKTDAAKAKLFGKIGKLIIRAVKAGGADPASNGQLADLLKQARIANVPKDIIERNIKKASDASQADFSEVLYEAYGPGGTGFIIDCLTDNLNRTASDVRAAVAKGGGKMADPGSVMFNFKRQGLLLVRGPGLDEDAVFSAATDAGADDLSEIPAEEGEDPAFKVLSSVEDFATVRDSLLEMGLPLDSEASGLVYTPLVENEVEDEVFEKNEAFLDRVLALDDVDAVYTNCGGLAT